MMLGGNLRRLDQFRIAKAIDTAAIAGQKILLASSGSAFRTLFIVPRLAKSTNGPIMVA
jgi:hypothetical protein